MRKEPRYSASAPTPLSQHQFSLGNVTPSLDGSAITSYQKGSGYWGILYYFTNYLSTPDQQATNYSAEWSFQIDNVSNVQASEFDFPVVLNNLKFYFGSQCVPHGYWQYWNPDQSHWYNTSLRCTQITPGWHTLRWLGTRNGTQFTYSKLEIDGALYNVGIQINAAPRRSGDPSNGTMTVQYQADGKPGTGYYEYVDQVNAWVR